MSGVRIMVLGSRGFIGPAVLRRAIAQGHHPIAVTRSGAEDVPGAEAVRLDRNEPDAVAACLRSVRPDTVIDLLAYTARDTLPLLARLAGRVARYVMASSGDVYRQYDLLHRRDVGVPLARLSEDAPLRTRLYPYRTDPPRPAAAPDAWMDDYDKVPIERALTEMDDLSWSVLRLPMVYGPKDRNHRFAWAVRPMARGAGVLKIDAEWADWRTSLAYLEDVAEALVLAAVHPQAHARLFNVGPREVKSNLEWAGALAAVCGWRGELQVVARDQTPEPMRSRLAALDLRVPFVLDAAAIREALGYSEVVPLDKALVATVAAEDVAAGYPTGS